MLRLIEERGATFLIEFVSRTIGVLFCFVAKFEVYIKNNNKMSIC